MLQESLLRLFIYSFVFRQKCVKDQEYSVLLTVCVCAFWYFSVKSVWCGATRAHNKQTPSPHVVVNIAHMHSLIIAKTYVEKS